MLVDVSKDVGGIDKPLPVETESLEGSGAKPFAQIARSGLQEPSSLSHGHHAAPLQQDLNRVHIVNLLSGFQKD